MKSIKYLVVAIIFLISLTMLAGCGNSGYIEDENGDIHITKGGVTLSDMDVSGDLYVDETVEDGDFTLEKYQCKRYNIYQWRRR